MPLAITELFIQMAKYTRIILMYERLAYVIQHIQM